MESEVLSNPKSFDWYLTSSKRAAAQAMMTSSMVTVAVEGEDDWAWIHKLIVPNRAHVKTMSSNMGGKAWVLQHARSQSQLGERIVGIIDRDLEGFAEIRNEMMIDSVFDTEVRDSEVLIASSGVLEDAMRHDCSPLSALAFKEQRIGNLISEALSAASIVGAFQLASVKRSMNRKGKVVPKSAWIDIESFFASDATGIWKLNFSGWLNHLEDIFKWSSGETQELGKEASNIIAHMTNEAKSWLELTGYENANSIQVERGRHLLLSNGHILMKLISKAWAYEMDGPQVAKHAVEGCYKNLTERCHLLFGVSLFRTTELFKKIDSYCCVKLKCQESIFRLA